MSDVAVVAEKARRVSVDAEVFVKAFVDECRNSEAPSCAGVVTRLGLEIKPMSVYQRAAGLRKEGVNLPVIPLNHAKQRGKLSVEKPNAIIAG